MSDDWGGTTSIWTSSDAVNWIQAPYDIPENAGVRFWRVAGGPPGFVIAGTEFNAGNSFGLAYFSADGTSWQRLTGPLAAPDANLDDVVFRGDEFLLFAESGIFSSSNGVDWVAQLDPDVAAVARGFQAAVSNGSSAWAFSLDDQPACRTTQLEVLAI